MLSHFSTYLKKIFKHKTSALVLENSPFALSIIFMLGLWILKINDPYYWDELSVYAKGSLYLYDHKLSMMPEALPPILSRGHTLFVYFITALSFRIFGPNVWVAHSLHMILSILTVYFTYKLAYHLFKNKFQAGFSSLVLVVQVIFMSQAGLVLPEMMIALFTISATYFFLKENYTLYALLGVLAVMTKETSIVFFATLSTYYLVKNFKSLRDKWQPLLYQVLPLFALLIFLFVQKKQNGWYFFPEHIGYVSFDGIHFNLTMNNHLSYLFYQQGRWFLSLFIILFLIKTLIFDYKKPINSIALLFFFILLVNLSFFGINFSMNRYLLYLYPFFCIVAVYSVWHFYKKGAVLVIITSLIISLSFVHTYTFDFDTNMHYRTVLQIQKDAIKHLYFTDSTQLTGGTFPMYDALKDRRTGYIYQFPYTDDLDSAVYIFSMTQGVRLSEEFKKECTLIYSIMEDNEGAFIYKKIKSKVIK